MKKVPPLADGAAIADKLGFVVLTISDHNDKQHSFAFLPKRFKQFAEFIAQANRETVASEAVAFEALPRDAKAEVLAALKIAHSTEPGFAVFAAPVDNIAFLRLREPEGQETVMPFDEPYLRKLIEHLTNALKAITAAAPARH
jgi:hypothetical protein